MHDRYPADVAWHTFHPDNTIRLWADITCKYAAPLLETDAQHAALKNAAVPSALAVRTAEGTFGHEVVAFLHLFTMRLPDDVKRHIHVGLTSSDLVDYALFRQMRDHARDMAGAIRTLRDVLNESGKDLGPRAGRTHGQLAAPTSWNHQMRVIAAVLNDLANEINKYANDHFMKWPGPTGHTPPRIQWLDRVWLVPSTQVVPRDYVLRWAALYLRLSCQLENLALQVRLASRSDVREVREGATDERVGSSSMPTKKNPISSEKVCGLARVVRGQFMALAEEVALWEDRDLTNSSTERITIPDMAATVEHMLTTMLKVTEQLVFNEGRMHHTFAKAVVHVAAAQSLLQTEVGMGPVEAGDLIRSAGPVDGQGFHYLRQVVWNRVRIDFGAEAADRWQVAFTDYYRQLTEE